MSVGGTNGGKDARAEAERLYRLHRGDVFRFVLGRVGDREEAEDVTQAAFVEALRALDRGNTPLSERPWLLTIAENLSRRRHRRAGPAEVAFEDEEERAAPPVPSGLVGDIRDALERLPDNQRAVLVLRELGGHSTKETADRLGLTTPAVEMALFRARRSFRTHFGEHEEGTGLGLLALGLAKLARFGDPVRTWYEAAGPAARAAGVIAAAVVGSGVVAATATLPRHDDAPPPAARWTVSPADVARAIARPDRPRPRSVVLLPQATTAVPAGPSHVTPASAGEIRDAGGATESAATHAAPAAPAPAQQHSRAVPAAPVVPAVTEVVPTVTLPQLPVQVPAPVPTTVAPPAVP
jgi:RNA polymerase sigma-70 factor (ECF subfamily)